MVCASSITRARPARIVPIGAQRPLFRLTATVFTGVASSDHRDAERDRGVEEPRSVEMDVGARACCPLASLAVSSGVSKTNLTRCGNNMAITSATTKKKKKKGPLSPSPD